MTEATLRRQLMQGEKAYFINENIAGDSPSFGALCA